MARGDSRRPRVSLATRDLQWPSGERDGGGWETCVQTSCWVPSACSLVAPQGSWPGGSNWTIDTASKPGNPAIGGSDLTLSHAWKRAGADLGTLVTKGCRPGSHASQPRGALVGGCSGSIQRTVEQYVRSIAELRSMSFNRLGLQDQR